MAWVTPVTDRTSGAARMTYADMNRITGNISYLYQLANSMGYTVSGADVSQTSWTQNDIISRTFWSSMLSVLTEIRSAVGLGYNSYNRGIYTLNYKTINAIEKGTLQIWEHLVAPSTSELLLNENSIQMQTNSGVDIEAGIL